MNDVTSIDPRTGRAVEVAARETSLEELEQLCLRAAEAAPLLEDMGRRARSGLLGHMADALEVQRAAIVAVADRETALGATRLNRELTRTCYQLRLFGEVLEEGSYLEAAIDHRGDTPMGPRPDLRRILVPLGPVAVFGASNFPLAFSVPGGDTASALAAGCPVVIKAHPSHPATSELCHEIMSAVAERHGAPAGALGLVHGLDAGAALVADPLIHAVGFTGSVAGGRALLEIIERRPDPIPFFGELSSLNPVVVTERAAEERSEALAQGIVGSFTQGAGQFCTKPGLVFVPAGAAGDQLVKEMTGEVSALPALVLLNGGIAAGFSSGLDRLEKTADVEVLARGAAASGEGFEATPTLLTVPAAALGPSVLVECFGPVTVVARYTSRDDLFAALGTLPGSLTATVLRGEGEIGLPNRVGGALRHRTGRLLFDSFPTGVAVSWAQHHGGPWPSTNTQHTSVGTASIRRFLRPVTYQDAPAELLPDELRDDGGDIPRRVDGHWTLPGRDGSTS
jgi:NADP-dependent aldehyde dehydrogenase